jgi:nucleotide-binding universal stress UspA family protein
MTPRSILAVTDFSPRGNNALARAALLSAEHGATLKLVYLAYPGEAPPADAATRLAHHALQLGQRHGIRVRAVNRLAFTVQDLRPEVSCADLVVWGTATASSLRTFFLGQPVEELLRTARRPILVVRSSAEQDYKNLLVAVDFSQVSRGLVDLGFALNPAAQLELFHAVSTANEGKLRYAEVSEQAIQAYRRECQRYAQGRMFTLTDSYAARRNRLLSSIGRGDPARQVLVQQQHTRADLIVVGKHPASALSDLMFQCVAHRLLRDARTDVLVVPHDFLPASSASAVARLADEPAARRVRAGAPRPPSLPNPAAMPG